MEEMKDVIEEIKDIGLIDTLYSHQANENAEILLQVFLSYVLQNHSDEDLDDLEKAVIESLEEMED